MKKTRIVNLNTREETWSYLPPLLAVRQAYWKQWGHSDDKHLPWRKGAVTISCGNYGALLYSD